MKPIFLLLMLFVSCSGHAETINLDMIRQGGTFEATHSYEPNPWFSDSYKFSVIPNNGVGVAAINARFQGSNGIKFTLVEIWDGLKRWSLNTVNPANGSSYFVGHWIGQCTDCTMTVEGRVIGGGNASYTGNWTVVNDVAPVPLPAAFWLFGFGVVGLLVRGRK